MAHLGIGVLGSGYMGRTYAECLTRYISRSSLVAVSGGHQAPQMAADYGVPYEKTYQELLARPDLDAVVIATPWAHHCDHTIQAAENGKHVFVEKPMAMNLAQCDAMIAACAENNVMLQVNKALRFRGTPRKAKELIDAGRIGQVRMIEGRSLMRDYGPVVPDRQEEVSAFLDMGVHNFDIMRFWTGSEVERVFGHLVTYGDSGAWLSAMVQVVFANGVMAHQWTSHEIPAQDLTTSQHMYLIVGETGVLEIDGYGKLVLSTPAGSELIWEQAPMDFTNRPLEPVRLETFYTQLQAFIDDVLEGRPPTVSGADGRAAVEICEAALLSSNSGKAVKLPLAR